MKMGKCSLSSCEQASGERRGLGFRVDTIPPARRSLHVASHGLFSIQRLGVLRLASRLSQESQCPDGARCHRLTGGGSCLRFAKPAASVKRHKTGSACMAPGRGDSIPANQSVKAPWLLGLAQREARDPSLSNQRNPVLRPE